MNPAMNDRAPPFSDDELHALADGRLPPAQAEALHARLTPEARARVEAWQAQRTRLQALHAAWTNAPSPVAQQAAAARLQTLLDQRDQWWRWGGMAAGWLLAFGLGWLGHGQWPGVPTGSVEVAARAPNAQQQFAQQAAIAHAVFQPEQRHPVEVTAAQQDHLVQWLSKRLGRPLKIPALHAQGFELVGGRLLPGDSGARAQFMYQNAAGVRVTLYLGALDSPEAARETAFRFHTEGPVPGFYWADQGFGYALSGALPRAALLDLATAVHRQL